MEEDFPPGPDLNLKDEDPKKKAWWKEASTPERESKILDYVRENFDVRCPGASGKKMIVINPVGSWLEFFISVDWREELASFTNSFNTFMNEPLPQFREFSSVIIPRDQFFVRDGHLERGIQKRLGELGWHPIILDTKEDGKYYKVIQPAGYRCPDCYLIS